MSQIIQFTFSLILTNLLQIFYNSADLIIVGQFSDNINAVGAIGATNSLGNFILNFFIGLSVGVSVLVSHGYGRNDRETVHKVVHTSITVAVIAGLLVSVVGIFFSGTFLKWMGTSEAILKDSTTYLTIIFMGAPFNILYNFGASILRAQGDTKRPLYFLAFSGVVNVILNIVFVCLFDMDVDGVAIATIISQLISAVLVLQCLHRQDGYCKLSFSKLRIHGKVLLDMIRIGLPASIQNCLFSISNILIQSSVNSFDTAFIAEGRAPYANGSAAASSIEAFVYMSMNAVYQAALNFTGQNYAAKQYKRTRKVLLDSILFGSALGIVMGALILTFGKFLIGIYTPGNPDAVTFGYQRMFIICSTYFLCGIMDITVGALRGLGKSFAPMLVSVIGICGFRIFWIYTIFAANHTWITLFLSYPISWIITGALHLSAYFFIQRKFPKEDMARTEPVPAELQA